MRKRWPTDKRRVPQHFAGTRIAAILHQFHHFPHGRAFQYLKSPTQWVLVNFHSPSTPEFAVLFRVATRFSVEASACADPAVGLLLLSERPILLEGPSILIGVEGHFFFPDSLPIWSALLFFGKPCNATQSFASESYSHLSTAPSPLIAVFPRGRQPAARPFPAGEDRRGNRGRRAAR